MGIYWKHIDPQLEILGSLQQINYSALQNLSRFQFNNSFVPTSLIPARHFFEFRNNGLSGFRFYHTTNSGDTHGSLALQSFVNAEDTGIDIFKFLQDGSVHFSTPVSFDNLSVTGNLDMDGHKIVNLADPVNPQDAATKAFVLNAVGSNTITLTGAVTGSSSTGTISTTLTPITTLQISNFNSAVISFGLDQFSAPVSAVNFNTQRLINVATPTAATDAANRSYVDAKTITLTGAVTGTGVLGNIATTLTAITTSQISNFNAAVTAFRLDQFAIPTAAINFNAQRLTNIATPTATTDGANKAYVDAKTITLTGAVTGTGVLGSIATTLAAITTSQISNFNAAVTAFRLDQFAAPTAAVNFGGQRLTNVGSPTIGTDGANRTYVDTAIAAINPTTILTGAVTGTGNGTVATSFAASQNISGAVQTFNINSGATLPSFFTLNNQTTIPTNGAVSTTIRLLNATTASGFDLIQGTGQDPLGNNIQLRVFSSGGTSFSSIWSVVYDSSISDYGFRVSKQANFTGNAFFSGVTGVQEPTFSYSAATKNYVDLAVAGVSVGVTLTGAVTGSGTGTIATTLSPITVSQISNFNSSVTAFRLDQFAAPTTAVSFGTQRLINVATPTATTDGTNKAYVDGKTITLTGAVTGTGVLGSIATTLAAITTSQISNFNAAVTAFRLDQFAAPTAAVNFNSQRLTNVATPTAATDAANRSYVDAAIFSGSAVTLTGAVIGTGAGTVPTVLNSALTVQGSTQTLVFNDMLPSFVLKNTIPLTTGQTSFSYLHFRNSYNYGYSFYNSTPYDSTSTTGGTFGLSLNYSGGLVDVFKFSLGGLFNSSQLTLAYQVGIGVAPNCPLDFGTQNNNFPNKMISLYSTNTNDHQFFGFGMDDSSGLEFRAQIDGSSFSSFSWNAGVLSNSSNSLMKLTASGNLTVGLNAANQSARLTIVGGVQTIVNEDSCINVFGNTAATKIEIQNAKKHEIRSQSDGSFVIYDRTSGIARQTLAASGAAVFSGDMSISGTYFGKKLAALLTIQGNTTGASGAAGVYTTLQGTYTAQYLYLFTQGTATFLTYNGPTAKMDVTLCVTASHSQASPGNTVSFAIFKNNVRIGHSTISTFIVAGTVGTLTTTTVVDLVAGDNLSIGAASTGGGVITPRDVIMKISL